MKPAARPFAWIGIEMLDIPEGIEVLVAEAEGIAMCVATLDESGYLFDSSGEAIDPNLIRWWAYLPKTPDCQTEDAA